MGCIDRPESREVKAAKEDPDQGMRSEVDQSVSSICGDGVKDPDEACDDGGLLPDDGCDQTCQVEEGFRCEGEGLPYCTPICGDGFLAGDEECDDHDQDSGDGCSALCQIEEGYKCDQSSSECELKCGDGTLDEGEGCDDGNPTATDGCNELCQVEDGFICEEGDSPYCTPTCGDGYVDGDETCDDDNQVPDDGCDGLCQIEEGYMCDQQEPSLCTLLCGNGVLDEGEQCDDGDQITEMCMDGETECMVCDDECRWVQGSVTYCGDGVINGTEECDGDQDCLSSCRFPPCHNPPQDCPELNFITIEGGSFLMGSAGVSDEIPIREVTVPTFKMMQTEVTVAQYQACVDAGVCSSVICTSATSNDGLCNSSSDDDRSNHPINSITWFELNTFAEWVGGRLPTEAEWEYAARSRGMEQPYPWGLEAPSCDHLDYNNDFAEGCEIGTSAVCTYPDYNTVDDLCDMAGNVAEWVQDEYHINYTGAPMDGSGWCEPDCRADPANNTQPQRVIRGGGWADDGESIRTSRRDHQMPSSLHDTYGGRVVRD